MRAILIDPDKCYITDTQIEKSVAYGISSWTTLLGSKDITHVYAFGNRDMSIVSRKVLDDTSGRFKFQGYEGCGKSLIVGVDGYGESCDCYMSVDMVREMVTFHDSPIMTRNKVIDELLWE